MIESLLLAKIVKLTNFDYEKEPSLSPTERERIRTGLRSLEFYDPNFIRRNTKEAAPADRRPEGSGESDPVRERKPRKAKGV